VAPAEEPDAKDSAPKDQAQAQPATVTIAFDTTPSGANVLVEGVHRGITPLELTFDRSEAPVAVEFSLPGHRPMIEAITPNVTQRLGFVLETTAPKKR
jgi:hypothetical protein